jgi:hypothetical protein
VIVCNEKGASDFSATGRAITVEPSRLCYVAFALGAHGGNAWTGAEGNTIKKPNAQWIKPGLVGHVRFLKGEGGLSHATLTEVREED